MQSIPASVGPTRSAVVNLVAGASTNRYQGDSVSETAPGYLSFRAGAAVRPSNGSGAEVLLPVERPPAWLIGRGGCRWA